MSLKSTFSLLFLGAALVATAQTPVANPPVTATIDASRTSAPISPYIYGQFLEHAGHLVYGNLWSELLDDRKFYYAVGPKPKVDPNAKEDPRARIFGRGDPGAGRWNPLGPVDSVVMDTKNPFAGDHTPQVNLDGSEPR
ncbi:MAG: hypothetical protein ABI273_16830, partial [Lacunisphaera sp.]